MPPHLPTSSSFPHSLAATITSPPQTQSPPTNIILFLHGLGDTSSSFSQFPSALHLPSTLHLTLQAPMPLPFDMGGFHWGDDILFDQSSGSMDFGAGFDKTVKILKEDVIERVLIRECGYKSREILMFGFGQGGMAALATAAAIDDELGGVVSIGGPVPSSVSGKTKGRTPVLVLGGSSDSLVGKPAIMDRFKDIFGDDNVQYHKWKKAGDSMPRSREEMLPIMQFFARRLRQAVPEGSVEIG